MDVIDLGAEIKRQKQIMVADHLMFSSTEAREMLGIGKSTLDALTKAGYISWLETGDKKWYPKWALEKFTYDFINKRIDLKTLEVTDIKYEHEEVVQRLKNENKELNSKVEAVKEVLNL